MNYKTILGKDKCPRFKKITTDKFIVKLPTGGQYSIYKNHSWSDLWHVRDDTHNNIGYGENLRTVANIILKDYCRIHYNTWFIDNPRHMLLCIQYTGIMRDCAEKEIMITELTAHKQKFMVRTYKEIINKSAGNDEEILKILDNKVQTIIHCSEEDYETEEKLL